MPTATSGPGHCLLRAWMPDGFPLPNSCYCGHGDLPKEQIQLCPCSTGRFSLLLLKEDASSKL